VELNAGEDDAAAAMEYGVRGEERNEEIGCAHEAVLLWASSVGAQRATEWSRLVPPRQPTRAGSDLYTPRPRSPSQAR
jgi:hypothetical protein